VFHGIQFEGEDRNDLIVDEVSLAHAILWSRMNNMNSMSDNGGFMGPIKPPRENDDVGLCKGKRWSSEQGGGGRRTAEATTTMC
jgi:hypothetical protein